MIRICRPQGNQSPISLPTKSKEVFWFFVLFFLLADFQFRNPNQEFFTMAAKQEIILYHYSFSPYARRIVWYLNLRQIPYTQCHQPPTMPRPDITAIGTLYRRIPILSIGRSVYNDTRLILQKLETFYPPSPSHPALSSPESGLMEKMFETWTVDAGLFMRASQLIPADMPLLKDEKFQRDREEYTGRSWSREGIERARGEALVDVRGAFERVEGLVLGDGREWNLKGALPPTYISATHFPKVFAWIERFSAAERAAASKLGKPRTIKGPEALEIVSSSDFAEGLHQSQEGEIEDPTGLKLGQEIEVWPIDSGFRNRDRGTLVRLDGEEVVIERVNAKGVVVRVHAPRHGFRVRGVGGEESRL
ncbi:hypothetical protein HYFRA_00007454 [Hymenoscyphus fraxineus]|uniref:GST N-terminal domain-containing protein n=1 Tax=Hymenoscyphus fraxineus TaxID=746836 RepID=A0A9N9KRU4_9HELO|nr:hypothetical protein HYFRA_00007454 [Hymenoscyphus fraxineus]